MMQIFSDLPLLSLLAWELIWYPSSLAACSTSLIFSALTFPLRFSTLETVPWDTPARFAISLIVAILCLLPPQPRRSLPIPALR